MSFKDLLSKTKTKMKKNSPEILLGVGIAGMATTVIFAIKATPKAVKIIEDEKEEKKEELTGKEIIKSIWKLYIPTTCMFFASTACLIQGNRVNAKRQIVLYSALKTSETLAGNYRDKFIEKLGEKKVEQIEEEIAEDQIKEQNNSVSSKQVYHIVDAFTGMEFDATPTQVKKAMNDICFTINRRDYASINEFYEILNAKPWPLGEDHGWSLSKCLKGVGSLPDVELNPMLDAEDNVYLELVYTEDPYTCYDNMWSWG